MNVRTRRRVAALLLLLALLLPQAVQADSASITCYGEDLTSEQYTLVLDLLEADPALPIRCKPDENSRVGWFGLDEAVEASSEPWFRERIYSKLNAKLCAGWPK